MTIGSVSNSACSFKGIGAMQIGDKVRLVTSGKMEKTLFSNPALNDTIKEVMSSRQAQECLSTFGKYAKKVTLDPTHTYQYVNAQGAAQLFDTTAKKNVIQGVKKLSRPITTFIKSLFGKL